VTAPETANATFPQANAGAKLLGETLIAANP